MKVKAAPGIHVPKEDKPREFITETEAVELPNSAYYLRLLADGDLLPADAANVGRSDKTSAKDKGDV